MKPCSSMCKDDPLRELLFVSRALPLFTCRCVLAEVRSLAKSHSEAFYAAQLLATVHGVPVIYGLKNLFIEQPFVQQRQFAQLDEKCKLIEKSEFKKLLRTQDIIRRKDIWRWKHT